MKLLCDQNLSPKLVARLADLFPDSSHVQTAGLDRADDDKVWDYARLNGYAIVTKDEDYYNLSVLRGCPPKVIWLQIGNCTMAQPGKENCSDQGRNTRTLLAGRHAEQDDAADDWPRD